MEDVAITWDRDLMQGIIKFNSDTNDLDKDVGLSTAVLVSLFTDARAKDDDPLPDVVLPEDFPDRRGWWADSTSERANDSVGSRLWLLSRSRSTTENLRLAEQYAKEALQWMIDEGIAAEVDCAAEASSSPGGGGMDLLLLDIKIIKKTGEELSYQFESLWEGTVT